VSSKCHRHQFVTHPWTKDAKWSLDAENITFKERREALKGETGNIEIATADQMSVVFAEVLGRVFVSVRSSLFLASSSRGAQRLRGELWTSSSPLYRTKPNFLNLFMKKLTRERVVPTISARVSWLILGIATSGFPSLPK
jgi:hypothetical protein